MVLSLVPLLSQTESPKQTGFPLLNVITEALIGLALARGKSNSELEELLKAPNRSHASSSFQNPIRYKLNTPFIIQIRRTGKMPFISFYTLYDQ